jgi:hypothetical protein
MNMQTSHLDHAGVEASLDSNPAHRWWYFPDMSCDEVLLVKFHDSDRSVAWRTPHTSCRDPRVVDAAPRESIEFRTVAFFL